MKRLGVIIPAGGIGIRMGGGGASEGGVPKQFMLLGGEPVLARAIRAFEGAADIVVALPRNRFEEWAGLCEKFAVPKHKVCAGGPTRTASVSNALKILSRECELIAVHDAARPLVSRELVRRTVETARTHGSAVPVVPIVDSIRRVEGGVEDRTQLVAIQTPQVFRAKMLREAYEEASGDYTDDATLVEVAGHRITLCEGERRNIKITEPTDLRIAETIL